MRQQQNRKFVDDNPKIAAMRVIFVKWMKERREWQEYKSYVESNTSYSSAWETPNRIEDFLGETAYKYDTYLEWCDFCKWITPILNEVYFKYCL